jgi:hypothetical protein
MSLKNLLVTLTLLTVAVVTATTSMAADQKIVELDDLIKSDSILIKTTYDGRPMLAATGKEVKSGLEEAAITRAKKLCEKFGYHTPSSLIMVDSQQGFTDVVDFDENGNLYNISLGDYGHNEWTANGYRPVHYSIKIFKSVRCSR